MGEWESLGQRVLELAAQLVKVPSVVDTDGEGELARVLFQYLQDQTGGLAGVELKLIPVPKPTDCAAVFGFIPAKAQTTRTILLMGHFDVVGLEPYGSLAGIAYDSDALKKSYADHSDPALAEAAASPDWNFGRGWHDMKGGVAVITELFIREAQRRELPVNLVLLLTPDEESASRGLRALVPELLRLKRKLGLDFTRVLNADYITPLFRGDTRKYLYSGTVGKLLLGLSVFGATTHAGETFDGVNAAALGGWLAQGMEHNRKLLQGAGGEWLPPPTVLHMGDKRRRYDVMTVEYAEVYVNMFHSGGEAKPLWRSIVHEVRRQANRYDREMRLRYNRFCARADIEPPRDTRKPEVIDFAELLKHVRGRHSDANARLEQFRGEAAEQFSDERDRAFHVVRKLYGLLPAGRATVVVSLIPPFYPASVSPKGAEQAKLIKQYCRDHGLSHRWVYPYISDMSYFAFSKHTGLDYWKQQAPLWFTPEEIAGYLEIAAPVVNLGPWGIGAHKETERVHLPFLRDELPKLLHGLMEKLCCY